ncbi:MAG: CPBP family intramembrane metalloprotease [Archangium sp.]|nr:CPBP family intramembrane metalloprotease [Archangium sp.]
MIRRLGSEVSGEVRALAGEPTTLLLGATTVLLISHYQGSTGAFHEHFSARYGDHPALSALSHFWWFGTSMLFYVAIPLLLSVATRGRFNDRYGFGLGNWREGVTLSLVFGAVMVPVVWWASTLESFAGLYPLAGSGAYTLNLGGGKTQLSLPLFVGYEAAYFAYFIGWEFLFRGWLTLGLEPHFGRTGALMVPIAPFALMHFGKAEPEALGSIIAGLALGLLALRTRSFWYGAVLHGGIAVFMDVVSAWKHLAKA